MFALLAPLLGEAGAALGARAALSLGATEGGIGAKLGTSLGQQAGVSAARHLSNQFTNNKDN